MKKKKTAFLFLILLTVFAVGCTTPDEGGNSGNIDEQDTGIQGGDNNGVIRSGDLYIHFLELGNKFVGDCVYINYGEIDILIDAGSKQDSAATIMNYINGFMQDEKIEFIIATHAHEDHIAGFYTFNNNRPGILDSYDIGVIIDFPKTNSTTSTYNHYVRDRGKAVERGTIHYTALQCYNEEGEAKRIWDLGGGVKLEILYSYYYENESTKENDYSVCVRIIEGDKQYLFTGDMEEEGENKLVEYYEEHHGGLGQFTLFKGAHHGSNTSSREKLMAEIRPEYVCVCTCAGTTQYATFTGGQFPTQNFINRIAPYTDKVYLTTLMIDFGPLNSPGVYESFNGNIVFSGSGDTVTVTGSNHSLKLKDTQWFKDNRTLPPAWQ